MRLARFVVAAALAAVIACGTSSPPGGAPPGPRADAAVAVAPTPTPTPTADAGPDTTTRRDSDGTCEPVPDEGTPCGPGDSWCVLSWGDPGGSSLALWCRDGRWELESEANLGPDDDY